MSFRKVFFYTLPAFALFGLILVLSPGTLQAQEDDACATVVMQALAQVDDACKDTGRDEACYGNRLVEVEPVPDANITFDEPGDLTALTSIHSLHTAPLNVASEEWGIALMKVQANLEGTLPGQYVTFLMTGDVSLVDASADAESAPMQTFYFDTGIGETGCNAAPNSLVIQSPQGTRVTLNVNGVDINLGSTAVLETRRGESMDVLLVGGEGQITALDESQTVPAGQATTIALGGEDGLTAIAPPTMPEPFDPARIQYMPFYLLPEAIEVPATVSWVDTGIVLRAGQTFTVSASGFVNTHAVSEGFPEFNSWFSAQGIPVDDACIASAASLELLPGFDCRCPTADCPLPSAPLMILVGRVGGGEVFVIGPGGSFTASGDGSLMLAVNDDGVFDNAGSFTVIVTVQDASDTGNPPFQG